MKKHIIIITVFLLAATSTMAQDGITMHFMRLNPYSTYTNPSAFIQYKGYVGFPIISNINMALTNSGLHYDNVFVTDPSTKKITAIDMNNALAHMSKNGDMLNMNMAFDVIDFGFRAKKWNISFAYRVRCDEYMTYSKDVFGLMVNGNMAYTGEDNPAHLNMKLNLTAYQEISIGLRYEINPHWAIGFRPKLLFGIANVKSKTIDGYLYTNPTNYTLQTVYEADAKEALIVGTGNISMGELVKNIFSNIGASIDLGLTYRINDKIGISASALDLGFINWTTNCQHITSAIDSAGNLYQNGRVVFNGFTLNGIQGISQDTNSLLKSLDKYFPTSATEMSSYAQALAGRFIVEGYYNLGKYHRFTALFQGRIVSNQFLPSFTIAWNGTFLNVFDLCVNYTIAKHSYDNLGVGVGLNLGVFHIYALTDNIISICGLKEMGNHTNTNLQVGIVFDWGKLQEPELGGFKSTKNAPAKNEN